MRKIIVISSYTPSLVNFRFNLISELKSKGFEVICFGPDIDPLSVKKLEDNNIKFELYPLNRNSINPFADIKTVLYLRRRLKKLNPDIIIPYTVKPVLYSNLAIRFLNVKSLSLITGLGYYALPSKTLKEKISKSIITFFYKIGTSQNVSFAFQNRDDIRFFKEKQILNSDRYCITPGSGVDIDEYTFSKPVQNPVSFLFIGRLLKAKGVDVLLKTAREIKLKYPEIKFNIIGMPDPLSSDAISESVLKEYDKQGIVNYIGEVRNVKPYIENASVFVLPSYYREGVPRTLLEALAKGKPIITTDHVGCRETVVDGVNGFLIKPKSEKSLFEAIEKFILEPNLIVEFGKSSRTLAKKKFNVDIVNKILLNQIELICSNVIH